MAGRKSQMDFWFDARKKENSNSIYESIKSEKQLVLMEM